MTQFAEQLRFFLSVDHNCIFFCLLQMSVACALMLWPLSVAVTLQATWRRRFRSWNPCWGSCRMTCKRCSDLNECCPPLKKVWEKKQKKKHFLMISTGESAVGKYFLKGLCSWSETICIFWCSSFFVYLHKSSQHSVISSHRWLPVEEDWKHQEHLNLSLASL